MISDCKSLVTCKAHISRGNVDALLSVTVGKLIIVFKGVDSLPNSALVLDVAEALLIDSDLTKIVE